MNKDILGGYWKQLRGQARQTWGKLTDNDWQQIAGNKDKLAGMLQERYGWSKAKADAEVNDFLTKSEANMRNSDANMHR